jgi:hypothetical protein
MKRLLLLTLIVLGGVAGITGCTGVQPWEKEHLANPIMLFDSNKEEKAVREHFLGTREGSAGSFGLSGGGCGCN